MTARTCVLKLGGAKVEHPADLAEIAFHAEHLVMQGYLPMLVHGGDAEIAALHDALGMDREKRDGLRVTPDASMDLVTMVLAGLVNKRLVAALGARGIRAIGLSGVDLGMIRAGWLDREAFGRVGDAPVVDPAPIRTMLAQGWVPVIAPVSVGPDGQPINVNADTAAQAVAAAIEAHTLDFVSDVDGVRTAEGIALRLTPDEVEALIASAVVRGGMIPKLRAATAALSAGVGRVRVGDLGTMRRETCTVVTA